MASKRVFILGAGFSKQAGMPLATELTPLLRRKFEEYNHEEALAWLASLDERINWLNQTNDGAACSLNIEELFDLAHFDALAWKISQHMCPFGRNSRLSRSQLEVRWPLHDESYALLTFVATPCSWF